jgi:PAS domain S-box-containing protein
LPKLSVKGSFGALERMAVHWKGPFLESPKKAAALSPHQHEQVSRGALCSEKGRFLMKTIFRTTQACISATWIRHGLQRLLNMVFPMATLLWLALCCMPTSATANGGPKVLVLHSYHQGYLWTDMIQDGISQTLSAQFPKVEIFVEYMNTKRQTAEIMSPLLVEMYQRLYEKVKFDAIIASDNNALDFLLRHRDSLFPGVPVVFCGINDFFKYHLDPAEGYTGVREDLDIVSTIAVALKLHPETKKVALITDTTETGLINLGLVRKVADRFPHITFIELHELTAAQLSSSLKQLENNTIVLALAFFRDPEGRTFSALESMEFILSASPRPVYTVWDFYMAPGAVGGKLLSGRLQGENAAALVSKIIQGEKAGLLPVIESPTAYMFDFTGLRKFNINQTQLPEGSRVTGQPDTFYTRYSHYLWFGAALFTVQVLIISLLSRNIARRKREENARQKAQNELRETNEMFSLFMRHSPVYVYIKEVTSTESRVLQASYNFQDMVGIPGTNMIGKTMSELFPEEFAAKISTDDRAVIAKGEVLKLDEELNGRSYTTLKFPIVQGNKTLLAGFTIDITDRKRAEEQLLYSISLTNAALDSTPDGILLVDREGKITRWNQKFVDLWRIPGRLLMEPFTDAPILRHVTDQMTDPEAFLAKVNKLYENPEESSDDLLNLADGRIFERFSQPQKIGDEIVGRFWSFRDITERIRADEARQNTEKQLLHTQKLESLGVLAGGIAHDFNNILTVIIGNAELALMRINKESPATENLQRIEQAASRAADLARQMLAYSGKGKFVVESIDLNILLEEMLHMLEVAISKKALLRLNPYRPIPSVEADATQIRQIIMNIVINASEAIGDKSGVIAITTGCMNCDSSYLKDVWLNENLTDGLYVYLEIADTGCGMDRETLSKLFDPFFTTKFTGRGLGMAAVLGIVRGHKGAINIYSEADKGTTFKILLPASGKPAAMFNSEGHKDDWQGTGRVLLVDDEETVRGIGTEMLKELGFATITANDGREAIEIFKKTDDIALVILDLTMPRMDGEQCFRELRQLKPDVKVIVSSGYNEQEVTQKFVGKGLAGFVQKPYKLSVLKEIIRKVIL